VAELAPELSVLVVTYRNPELTRDCLASVFAQTREVPFEVIAVDNASGDETPDMVEREFPAVRLVRSDENLGFARANNLAARMARGEHLVLLNPDTIVLDRALERLLAFAGRERPGIYGGRTLRPSGALDPSSCWGAQTPWSAFCFASGLSTAFRGHRLLDPESLGGWQRDSVRDVGVVTGCLLLTRRDAWTALGGFDERFFMYGEDADLAVRARARGDRVAITPEATIVHVVGASSATSGAKMGMVMRSRATIMRKHWRPGPRAFGLACLLAGVAGRAAASRAARRARTGAGSAMWEDVWRARREWLGGYPAAGCTS
jgi:N-acetylglucosaminyl-diphospho-decaprenol L-rhamnosyltransferase